jgi:surface antigen
MSVIHINSEEMRQVAWELSQTITGLNSELPLLGYAANNLEAFAPDMQTLNLVNELRATLTILDEAGAAGDKLSLRLSREAALWETVDQEGARKLDGVCSVVKSISDSERIAIAPRASHGPAASTSETPSQPGMVEGTPATPLVTGEAGTAVVAPLMPDSQPLTTGWVGRLTDLEQINSEIKAYETRSVSSLSNAEAQHLKELYAQRTELNEAVQVGITDDKPGRNGFPEGQCTWYVASRRNVGYGIQGHAREWAEVAANTGYEVGGVPVKGAIMVWQPGVHGASETYGHVSYIEQVNANSDGSYTITYTDNDNMDPGAPARVTFTPGEAGVNFIYDRLEG